MPIPDEARSEISLSDPWLYATLAESVEAWGFRTSQERGEAITRREVAFLWLENEYRPVIDMLREVDLLGDGTATEAYMHVNADRYWLMRTDRWDEEVIRRVTEGGSRRGRRRR